MIPLPHTQALHDDLARLHLATQAKRAATTFAGTFVTLLVFAQHTAYDGKFLGAIAYTAAEAAILQIWPQASIRKVFDIVKTHLVPDAPDLPTPPPATQEGTPTP